MGQCLSKNLIRVIISAEVSGQLPTHPSLGSGLESKLGLGEG